MSGGEDLFGPFEGAPIGEKNGQAEGDRDWREDGAFGGVETDAVRARIGRPAGARNKRDADAERWYFAKGYADPMQRLGELVSEDPRVLQAWYAEHAGLDSDGKRRTAPTLLEVVNMQIKAAGELMPYLHGKKPLEVLVTDERLPALMIDLSTNQLAEGRALALEKALSIGAPLPEPEASKIKDLEDGQ